MKSLATVLLVVSTCLPKSMSLLYRSYSPLKRTITIRNPSRNTVSTLRYDSYDDRENSGLSLKVLGTITLLTLGVFGTGFLGSASNFLRELNAPESVKTAPQLKGSKTESNRGALTRLTKREINEKLQSVPIFFVTADDGKSVYTTDNIGYFFEELDDATKYSQEMSSSSSIPLTVSATSLDDVFFTLIEKKTKLGKIVSGISSLSDPSANYQLKASKNEYDITSEEYKQKHSINDYPLYRVPNLVFSKDEGLEVPLFLRKEDAITSYNRLQESKKEQLSKTSPSSSITPENTSELPELQEVSLLDILGLFQTGGFESRALEFYPSMDNIATAKKLMGIDTN